MNKTQATQTCLEHVKLGSLIVEHGYEELNQFIHGEGELHLQCWRSPWEGSDPSQHPRNSFLAAASQLCLSCPTSLEVGAALSAWGWHPSALQASFPVGSTSFQWDQSEHSSGEAPSQTHGIGGSLKSSHFLKQPWGLLGSKSHQLQEVPHSLDELWTSKLPGQA